MRRNQPAALVGVKAAATWSTIYAVEKLRRHKPLAAATTMAAVNVTYSLVALNSARTLVRVQQTRQRGQ